MSMTTPTIISLVDETTASKPMIMGLSDIMEYLRTLYDVDSSIEEFPEKIMSLMKDSYDKNGLKKWYNFYQPLVGTDTFINFVLNTIKIESDIVPWYETSNPTNTFDLVLSQYPEGLDREKFLETINFYKNIESKLASMRLIDCPMRFTLDSSKLDEDLLSDTSGVDVQGTTFCFRMRHKRQIFVSKITTNQNIVNTNSIVEKVFEYPVLGEFILDNHIIETPYLGTNQTITNVRDFTMDLTIATWDTMDDWDEESEWDEEIAHLVNGYRDFRAVAHGFYGMVTVIPEAKVGISVFHQIQPIVNASSPDAEITSNIQAFTDIYTTNWAVISGWLFGAWTDYEIQINTQRSTETV